MGQFDEEVEYHLLKSTFFHQLLWLGIARCSGSPLFCGLEFDVKIIHSGFQAAIAILLRPGRGRVLMPDCQDINELLSDLHGRRGHPNDRRPQLVRKGNTCQLHLPFAEQQIKSLPCENEKMKKIKQDGNFG